MGYIITKFTLLNHSLYIFAQVYVVYTQSQYYILKLNQTKYARTSVGFQPLSSMDVSRLEQCV